jgi:hypothetical protein
MLRARPLGDAVLAAIVIAGAPSVAYCRVPEEQPSVQYEIHQSWQEPPSLRHKVYQSWDEFMDDVRQGKVRYVVRGGEKLHGALRPEVGEMTSTFEMVKGTGQAALEENWDAIHDAGVSVIVEQLVQADPEDDRGPIHDAGVHVSHQLGMPNRWSWVATYWLAPAVWLLLLAACIVRWNDANGWAMAFFTGGLAGVLLTRVMGTVAAWGGGSDPTRINWRSVDAGIWTIYAGMVCAGIGGVLSIVSSVKRLRSVGPDESAGDA